MSGKKFSIYFYEWKYVEKEKGEKVCYIASYTFLQENGKKNTIKDIKNFIIEKSITELFNPVCPCCLSIYYLSDKKNNTVSECSNYKDETPLDDTVFNESKYICVYIPKEGKVCKKGCLQTNENCSKIYKKMKEDKEELEKKKKESEKAMELQINQLNSNYYQLMDEKDQEIQRQRENFQNFIEFQKQQNMSERWRNQRIFNNLNENLKKKMNK